MDIWIIQIAATTTIIKYNFLNYNFFDLFNLRCKLFMHLHFISHLCTLLTLFLHFWNPKDTIFLQANHIFWGHNQESAHLNFRLISANTPTKHNTWWSSNSFSKFAKDSHKQKFPFIHSFCIRLDSS